MHWRKMKDFNTSLLDSEQMLLPTEPLELWHWSRGEMVYIHRHWPDLLVVGFCLQMLNHFLLQSQ